MKIAIYSRKSKFTGKGESVENQVNLCIEYANKHYDNVETTIYEDEGFSGGTADRPQYQRLMRDIKNKKYDMLMCYRLDRISRNIADFADIIDLLQQSNVSFVSIREQFDTSTPMGRAMMYIASVFAQLERETIAERIRDNMHQLARSGRWLGGNLPMGFKSEPIVYFDNNMKEKKMYKLVPVDEEMNVVKLIFDKYLEYQSISGVETYLMQNSIRTRRNGYYAKRTLVDILTNPVYVIADQYAYEYYRSYDADIANTKEDFDGIYGLIAYNKKMVKPNVVKRNDISDWIIAIGKHKGIISGKDWISIQGQMKKNSMKFPREGTSNKAILSGLMKCGQCGSTLRVGYGITKADGEKYYYYRCIKKDISRKAVCSIKNLPGPKTDQLVIERLRHQINTVIINELENTKSKIKSAAAKNKEIQLKVDKNKRAIDNLIRQLSSNEDETFTRYVMQEVKRLDELNKELEKSICDNNAETDIINIELLKEAYVSFNQLIDTSDYHQQKKLIQGIVERINWDGNFLDIVLLKI